MPVLLEAVVLAWCLANGSSKSQLAIEFAHQVRDQSDDKWVFWVQADTRASIEEGFRAIADAVKLPVPEHSKASLPQLVHSWLSNEQNGRWLVVLDGADDFGVFHGPGAKYLPQSQNGSILLTTRDKGVASRLVGSYHRNIIDVGPMTEEDALELLRKRLGSLSESDVDVAAQLVRELDLIPLPIGQAAAYIHARAPRVSLKQYLAELKDSERKRVRLLSYDSGDPRRDGSASNSILATWQVSFDHIQSKRPSAVAILSRMSFCHCRDIPESLVKPRKRSKKADQAGDSKPSSDGKTPGTLGFAHLSNSDDAPAPSSANSDDETDDWFEDDVVILRDYSLVTVSEGRDAFDMQRLVQLATRQWLESRGQLERFKVEYIEGLAAAFPLYDESRDLSTCHRLFPHTEAAIDYPPSKANALEKWASLMLAAGSYAMERGSYDVLERMARRAKSITENQLGADSLVTMSSGLLLIEALSTQGKFKEAEELAIQALETSKSHLGQYSFGTLANLSSLILIYWRQLQHEDFKKVMRQILKTSKELFGIPKLDLDDGSAMTNQERAEGMRQVLEGCEEKFGFCSPIAVIIMVDLSSAWKAQGRRDEALALRSTCVEGLTRLLGPEHEYTVQFSKELEEWKKELG
jgi:tetratricopeptide (TPR) repeat protein